MTTRPYQLLKELKKPVHRRELGLAVIEGVRLVTDALRSGTEIERLFVSKSFASDILNSEFHELLKTVDLTPIVLSDSVFNAACDTKSPQGVLAVVKMIEYSFEDILREDPNSSASDKKSCVGGLRQYIILDGVTDPGNAGVIIRTAEAAGFAGMVMSVGCVDAYSPKTLRASMGSALRLPIAYNADIFNVIDRFKKTGVKVYATAPGAGKNYFNCDLSGNIALVIGNEAFGVRREIMDICDDIMRLPMPGAAESLNAGVAAGIIIYEALRQNYVP